MEVTREVVLEAPVEEVWAALTEPERLEEWFANDVELELEPGGEGTSAGTTARSGTRSSRRSSPSAASPSRGTRGRVAIELDEVDGGTRVRRHRDGRRRLEHRASRSRALAVAHA